MKVMAVFLAVALMPVVLFALVRLVGLGHCRDCRRACAPWDAYCWPHSPSNPNRRP